MAYVRKVRTASGAVAVQVARKDHGQVVILAHLGWACHSICVSPGWSIIGPPFGRTEGVVCDQGHRVIG